MTLRFCAYKNCESFINLKDRSLTKGITLFSFPKNPQRRLKWIEYGQVMPDLPPSLSFFCSKHFDKKFLAINNRRTALVGEAVPFPYVEAGISEDFQADSSLDYYLYEMNNDCHRLSTEAENDQDLHVGSTTTIQDDDLNEYHEEVCTIETYHPNSESCFSTMSNTKFHKSSAENEIPIEPSSSKAETNNIFTTNKACNKSLDKTVHIINLKELNEGSITNSDNSKEDIYEENFSIDLEDLENDDCTSVSNKDTDFLREPFKRKLGDNHFTKVSLSNAKVAKTVPTVNVLQKSQIANNAEKIAVIDPETKDDELDLEMLLDTKQVTTFIFKGEEYVQMPKEFYIREKMEMAKRLQKMLRTVKAIKEYVNKLDV